MLVISRKIGESLILTNGDIECEVTVARIIGGRVRIGVTADPGRVKIVRKELKEQKGKCYGKAN